MTVVSPDAHPLSYISVATTLYPTLIYLKKKLDVSLTGSVSALRPKDGKTGTEMGLREGAQSLIIESSL
jgi:hypothetical protein